MSSGDIHFNKRFLILNSAKEVLDTRVGDSILYCIESTTTCVRQKSTRLTGKIQTEKTFVAWKNEIIVDQFGILIQQRNAIADQQLQDERERQTHPHT